jgi:hypothetical protein
MEWREFKAGGIIREMILAEQQQQSPSSQGRAQLGAFELCCPEVELTPLLNCSCQRERRRGGSC